MFTLLIGLLACNNTPVVSGTVHDVWNTQLKERWFKWKAMGTNKPLTHRDGSRLRLKDVDGNLRFRAGHTEFIHDVEVRIRKKWTMKPSILFSSSCIQNPLAKDFMPLGKRYHTLTWRIGRCKIPLQNRL